MSLHSIRVQLTAWYALVMAVAFIAAGAATHAAARRQIQHSIDAATVSTTHNFLSALRDEMDEGHGRLTLRSANELLGEFRDEERAIVILDERGNEFASHQTAVARSLDRVLLRRLSVARQFGMTTVNGGSLRLYLAPADIGPQSFTIATAQSRARQTETLRNLRNAMLATAPIALLVACAGGYLLARKSLAPMVRMSDKARAISATNLSERIEVVNPRDELGELAATLNELLGRLDRSFADQRRFMADASHELRTPVAILQGELDVTLSRSDRDASDYRESLEIMHRTVRRLTRIIRDLFLLARSDAGDLPLKSEPLYPGDVVSQTVRAYRTVARDRGVTLAAECDDDLIIDGDDDLLQRMIGNLVENAIRHSPRGAEVRVHCAADGPLARIEVRDQGSGVPAECRERIFERFYRADPARTAREGSGAGLGLPIARRIAEVHGGDLRLEESGADGSLFAVTLPLRRAAAGSSLV